MVKLIQVEFLKLRRRKFIWVMLLSAFVLPLLAFLVFNMAWKTNGDPTQFYKWSAFNITPTMILPVTLGLLGTILLHSENKNRTYQQIWIVPIHRIAYFFSKFIIVFMFSICFMLLTAIGSIIFSSFLDELSTVAFAWKNLSYLFGKCLEFGVILPIAMVPILALATVQTGYILPVVLTLIYMFSAFFLVSVNMYLLPLSSMSIIVARNGDIPGLNLTQEINLPLAFLSIGIWMILSVCVAHITLKRK